MSKVLDRFFREALNAQIAVLDASPPPRYQSCLWQVVARVRAGYPTWEAPEAWAKLSESIGRLGGWAKWERAWNQPTLSKVDITQEEVGLCFLDSWDKYKLSDEATLELAARAALVSSFPLPPSPYGRGEKYEVFLRFLGYVSLYRHRPGVFLPLSRLALKLGLNRDSFTAWFRWASREGLARLLSPHRFVHKNSKRNRAAKWRVSRVLVEGARSEETIRHSYYPARTQNSPAKTLKDKDTAARTRRQVTTPREVHPSWLKLAGRLFRAISSGVKVEVTEAKLRASALELRKLHKLGGGEVGEKPSYREVREHLEAYCLAVEAAGNYQRVVPEWPVVASGASFRRKWDKLRGSLTRQREGRREPGQEPRQRITKVVTQGSGRRETDVERLVRESGASAGTPHPR